MKFLPDDDFRAKRYFLEPEDFALGSEIPQEPPRDLIDASIWKSMDSLQDDVSIRTSDDYGSTLNTLWGRWNDWNCLVGALQSLSAHVQDSPICHVSCDVSDEFQSSICNALVGFYRVAFSCLRNVIESMTIGTQLEIASDVALFQAWTVGDQELGLGWAADLLRQNHRVAAIEEECQRTTGDDFFRQRTQDDPGGAVRRLFRKLSKYTHGAPGFSDGDLRQSNGPILIRSAFVEWASCFRLTFAIAVFEAKLASPAFDRLGFGSRRTVRDVFEDLTTAMLPDIDGAKLLASLPSAYWGNPGTHGT